MKARLPWAIWAVTVLGLVTASLFSLLPQSGADRAYESDAGVAIIVAFAIFVLGFATVGALISSRDPSNPVGWIAAGAAAAYILAGVADSYVNRFPSSLADSGVVPRMLFAIGESLWAVGLGLGATLLLLLFPNGRLPSSRWRPVAWLAIAALIVIPVASSLIPGRVQDYPVINPMGIEGARPTLEMIVGIAVFVLLAAVALSIASLVVRYRRAPSIQRQQLKWFLFAASFVAVLLSFSIVLEGIGGGSSAVGEISNLLSTIALSLIPFAIGVAILKHRLYDIDVIINRALVYSALTAVLAAAYFGLVVLLQQILPLSRDSDVAVAASTLAVAALFRPLRSRLQSFIDQRFYRRRFDAQQTVQSFTDELRQQTDLAEMRGRLIAVVSETMQPVHISIWLRDNPREANR